ncbi:2OG-Fe(II) oxygenase [Parvibaculum sp.]|uniref:2OG-Fe(II) oxygenase n=1 Tax=Parvibaculum sp. TaxID=2024848 RepID=UPI0027326472|nr:2OG-Fe(II) oxygenase [Parvibaculum sp.]MDP3327217.1 2OG-Fe(II) oxygenase [Parvibaculum sp.]
MRINYQRLFDMGSEHAGAFRTASPFPSVCLDGLFEPSEYEVIASCFPDPTSDVWKKPENIHTKGKYVTRRGDDDLKELLFDDAARQVLAELNSGPFLRFLELLTGIKGLIGDPYLAEGGFHCSEDGGYLDIHADFSHHDALGLERRLNLIIYLNEGWLPEYGGALSLYDLDLNPVASFLPVANRAAIFETSDTSYHGHPEPMKLPAGVYRRSIALYYYSLPTGREKSRIVFPKDRAFSHQTTEA